MRSVLVRQLGRIGPVIDGSISISYHGYRNKEGKKTPQTRVQRYRGRKMHAVHVPRDLEESVKQWNGEYQHALDLLRQLCEVNEQIIRNYAGDKRARREAERQQSEFRLVSRNTRGKR